MGIWGSTFVVTKDVMAEFPPLVLAFFRVAIGAVLLLPLALIRHRRAAADAQPLPWGTLFAMGFIGVALYYFLFNLAMVYISASQGALVQSSIPAMTALIAVVWLREHASRKRIAGIVLSVVGVIIIFMGAEDSGATASAGSISGKWLGNLLMFGSVIAWGIYTSLAKRVAAFDPLVVTGYVIAIGAALLLPGALYELSGRELPRITAVGALQILYLGGMASGIAFLIYNRALEGMDASQAGVFANLIPVVGVLSGVVFLGEPLPLRAILGGVVVMLGVWITGSERPGAAPSSA
jgi:drug/metabolite transporter (DMT)-like permease